jgi:hypothetical protein
VETVWHCIQIGDVGFNEFATIWWRKLQQTTIFAHC